VFGLCPAIFICLSYEFIKVSNCKDRFTSVNQGKNTTWLLLGWAKLDSSWLTCYIFSKNNFIGELLSWNVKTLIDN